MEAKVSWQQRTAGAVESLRQEMESLFQRFFGEPLGRHGQGAEKPWTPRIDIEETDKEIVLRVDLPGLDAKDVHVAVAGDVLVLRGERKEDREDDKKTYRQVERVAGPFYREIPLPAGTDPDKIKAVSAKGVITITVPKKAEVQPRKIVVHAQD